MKPPQSTKMNGPNGIGSEPEMQRRPPDAPSPKLPKVVPFAEISRCGEEIWISHNGQLYRLRSTRQGKLILTK